MFDFLRRFTDRAVWCTQCGAPLGYMTLRGPKRWRHVACPPYAPVELDTA